MTEQNKLAELRENARLTQRALGARVGASWKHIARVEQGEEPPPALAFALSWALDQSIEAVFPGLAHVTKKPPPEVFVKGKRLTHSCDLPTWFVELELRGIKRTHRYEVDSSDAAAAALALTDRPEQQFVSFDSNARTIWVNRSYIQSFRVRQEQFTLTRGSAHGVTSLRPAHANLRIFYSDRPEPLSANVLDWQPDALAVTSFSFAHEADYPEFLSFVDNEGDQVLVRSSEVMVIELPTLALIEEMKQGPGDEFRDTYERLEFEGQPLSDREARSLLPDLASGLALT